MERRVREEGEDRGQDRDCRGDGRVASLGEQLGVSEQMHCDRTHDAADMAQLVAADAVGFRERWSLPACTD